MPALSAHQSKSSTKLLFIGDSGAGKTGALASLPAKPQEFANLVVNDLQRELTAAGQTVSESKLSPKHLNKSTDPETKESLGPVSTWGPQDILVIDSLSMLSTAALNFVLSMNARLGQRPQLQDWGAGQDLIESMVQMLYDESIVCNVIVISHITYIGPEDNLTGYPNTLGKALPPKLGRYFNTILQAKSQGQGAGLRRKILTNTASSVELKNTAPLRVKPDYPLETGLADYFAAVRG